VFDHVTIRVADREASERFYTTVLETLGITQTYSGDFGPEWHDFSLTAAEDEDRITKRLHIGFGAPSQEHVDAFWQAGTAAGYTDDGPPGPRPQYRHDYYGAFLLDPDGNSIEAVHHGAVRAPGNIDHIWIRVANVAAARRFYETIAPHAGFRLDGAQSDRAHFVGAGGSLTLRQGRPSENVHFAFPASDDATVDAFHRAGTGVGCRDNGPPGERPVYHEGYYAAFVLDRDGNNVEVVNHNRT
jgi:catechol 2,3-dioxygenase-like lactoylglutathione lyase family enzyme